MGEELLGGVGLDRAGAERTRGVRFDPSEKTRKMERVAAGKNGSDLEGFLADGAFLHGDFVVCQTDGGETVKQEKLFAENRVARGANFFLAKETIFL